MLKAEEFIDKKWHSLDKNEVLDILKTSYRGLSGEEAEKRLKIYGPNKLEEYRVKSKLKMFIEQFQDFVVLILIVASTISFILGEMLDATLIFLILIINALIGTYQEWRAEKAIVSLKQCVKLITKVRRDGKVEEQPSENLVLGDIVLLEQGDKVPADMRLLETRDLMIDESLLTGESLPVTKDADIVLSEDTPVSDRANMALAGTLVSYGNGIGVVVNIGRNTEIGKIAQLIQEIEVPETPLKKKTKKLGKQMSIIFIVTTILVFIEGIIRKKGLFLTLLTSVSLAVAAVPEGLPVFITLILAFSGLEMAKRNAIVRNLRAVETLGSTTVICSDKTGTLTENQMTVVKIVTANKEVEVTGSGYKPEGVFIYNGNEIDPLEFDDLRTLITGGILCNRTEVREENGEYKIIGDPLEGALITLARKAEKKKGGFVNIVKKNFVMIHEVPFDSSRKRMSSVYINTEGTVINFIKGSPEILLETAKSVQVNGEVKPLTEGYRKYFEEKINEMAKSALRTLAIGYKIIHEKVKDANVVKNLGPDELESDIILVGIVGMMDPPRKDSREFIEKAKKAGIKVVMVTGDHALTAKAIAKKIGIIESDDEEALSGRELDKMREEELRKIAENVKVYARVSPEAKVKIVRAYKDNGEITAMTGDGINDAPALKLADVGIAMGKRGTDVAREAADLILMDEKFPTIVRAIEVGRTIYDNIRKTVLYLLSSNIAEVSIIFFALLLNWPLAMLPLQILWLNLVSDGVPALGLSVDPPESDVMKRPPRDPKEPLVRKIDYIRILYISASITIVALMLYGSYLNLYGVDYGRTAVFTTMVFMEFFNALNMRTEKKSIFSIGILSNPLLVIALSVQIPLQLAIVYLPLFNIIFKTVPLKPLDFLIVFIASSIVLIIDELKKAISRRNEKRGSYNL
ncbi:MAG: cation-translocating P-type ATPase [Candidatus Njordarchaeia archaeon]